MQREQGMVFVRVELGEAIAALLAGVEEERRRVRRVVLEACIYSAPLFYRGATAPLPAGEGRAS